MPGGRDRAAGRRRGRARPSRALSSRQSDAALRARGLRVRVDVDVLHQRRGRSSARRRARPGRRRCARRRGPRSRGPASVARADRGGDVGGAAAARDQRPGAGRSGRCGRGAPRRSRVARPRAASPREPRPERLQPFGVERVVVVISALPSLRRRPRVECRPRNRGERPRACTMRRCRRTSSQPATSSSLRLSASRIHSSPSCSSIARGVFCTSEPDGVIHAVPMWFAVTGDSIALATSSRSRKVANLGLDPRATLVVHDSRPGTEICGVSIRGRAALVG